jgi:hypothetical protein
MSANDDTPKQSVQKSRLHEFSNGYDPIYKRRARASSILVLSTNALLGAWLRNFNKTRKTLQ